MQGRMVVVAALTLVLAACGSTGMRKADCWDCVNEAQSWKKFPFEELVGNWKGNIEIVSNDTAKQKKERTEKFVELRFESIAEFAEKRKVVACGSLPAEGIVMIGQVWDDGSGSRVYEVLGKNSEGGVSYGRATVKGAECGYREVLSSVGMNRMAFPAVTFSQRKTPNGRVLASGTTPEFEVSFEVLNFERRQMKPAAFADGGRRPMSAEIQDKPPLLLRVFRLNRKVDGPYARGEWTSTEEHLYRLWRSGN